MMVAALVPIVIRPQPGPQESFLATAADVAILGGAAGGGKSFALLMEPLRHIANPGFGATIFRRTYPQVMNQGGLWDEAANIYALVGGRPNRNELTWRWVPGGRVKFAHLQHDDSVYEYQGSQIPLIAFDEATHFSESQVFYMLSRNRSTCGVRPYVRMTCNPDADHWLAGFLAWWIDQATGYPIPSRSGRLRWFVRQGGELVWADDPEDLARYDVPPKSVTFIPATLDDNPILNEADPGYRANLLALPPVDQERLLRGNWKIRPAAGLVFNRAWFSTVSAAPAGGEDCRFWDLAATEKSQKTTRKKTDPDYTAGVLLRLVNGRIYVLDAIADRIGPADIDATIINTARQDAARSRREGARYRVRWEVEPGAAAKVNSQRLMEQLHGLDAGGVRPKGDKLERARPFAQQAKAGNVAVVDGAWNDRYLTCLHNQPDWPHDDEMDGSSGAYNELARDAGGTYTGQPAGVARPRTDWTPIAPVSVPVAGRWGR